MDKTPITENESNETDVVVPNVVRIALLVILNHVEPGWGNCVATVRQWLESLPK